MLYQDFVFDFDSDAAGTTVRIVLRKTSPCAADYPQLVEQYMDAVSAYRQAVADTENAMKSHTGTAA